MVDSSSANGKGGGGGNSGKHPPYVKYAIAKAVKKGEDFVVAVPKTKCSYLCDDQSKNGRNIGFFGVLDGHNGMAAASHGSSALFDNLIAGLKFSQEQRSGDGELVSGDLTEALVYSFGRTDGQILKNWRKSGTTATVAVLDNWELTIANVGDSRAVLDDGRDIQTLTYDFRLEDSASERERVLAAGGIVARLDDGLGNGVGPLRVWPGGLCLSRALGDGDVGPPVIASPHVMTVDVDQSRGGRLIIASDGLWDACPTVACATATRALAAEQAAQELVKMALNKRGLRDDTSVLVIDIIPARGDSRPPGLSSSGRRGMGWLCGMASMNREPPAPIEHPMPEFANKLLGRSAETDDFTAVEDIGDGAAKKAMEVQYNKQTLELTRRGGGVESKSVDPSSQSFGNGACDGKELELNAGEEEEQRVTTEAVPMWGFKKEEFKLDTFADSVEEAGMSGER